MAQKPETRFRNNTVLPFLKTLQNAAFFPIQQVAIGGDPDFFLCVAGRFVALELKDDGEDPRPLQKFKLAEVRKAGGVALVAYPSNWETVKRILLKMDRRQNWDIA